MKGSTRRRRQGVGLRLERLEGRELMACQVFESGGWLNVIGDRRANNVEIYDYDGPALEGDRSYIQVVCDGQVYETSTTITGIRVDLGNGNDRLGYELGTPDLFQQIVPTRTLQATLGNGNDRVYSLVRGFAFEADPSARALGPGSWTQRVDLGSGNDTYVMDLDADILGLERTDGVTASTLDVGVSGGSGNDWIEVNTTRALRVELANLAVALRGGSGNDTLTVRSGGELAVEESSVALSRYGEAGNDRILGVLDLAQAGDSAIDQLIDTGAGSNNVNTLFRSRTRRRVVS